ncbi:MAG: diphosphomevalonate decarboxylase, partial [Calditrichaeota bacterium]
MAAPMTATAVAHSNIALIKYWGKRSERLNLPAVGSISITLKELSTWTRVTFQEDLGPDRVRLNGRKATPEETRRVSAFLDIVRRMAGRPLGAQVVSKNNFPTGAGLASSASGFAALALAATAALGLELPPTRLSALARLGSGSAARSVFGGFVEMQRGQAADGSDACAIQLRDEHFWPLEVLVLVTAEGPKSIGSTRAMNLTADTSPYFPAWVENQ